ncbi:MAG: hypothetical protein U9532_02680 ['Conium maculatum' witches'-broom phytoplasma]|nr:hypothetical protein ['Conium maculatum' witches'-broom phytoplasma]
MQYYENNLFSKLLIMVQVVFLNFSLHLYRLLSVMQENRIKNLYEIKAAFINHELNLNGINKITTYYDKNLGKYVNNDDDENLALLYEQAKNNFKLEIKKKY